MENLLNASFKYVNIFAMRANVHINTVTNYNTIKCMCICFKHATYVFKYIVYLYIHTLYSTSTLCAMSAITEFFCIRQKSWYAVSVFY